MIEQNSSHIPGDTQATVKLRETGGWLMFTSSNGFVSYGAMAVVDTIVVLKSI